jgi:hypothetical protein
MKKKIFSIAFLIFFGACIYSESIFVSNGTKKITLGMKIEECIHILGNKYRIKKESHASLETVYLIWNEMIISYFEQKDTSGNNKIVMSIKLQNNKWKDINGYKIGDTIIDDRIRKGYNYNSDMAIKYYRNDIKQYLVWREPQKGEYQNVYAQIYYLIKKDVIVNIEIGIVSDGV